MERGAPRQQAPSPSSHSPAIARCSDAPARGSLVDHEPRTTDRRRIRPEGAAAFRASGGQGTSLSDRTVLVRVAILSLYRRCKSMRGTVRAGAVSLVDLLAFTPRVAVSTIVTRGPPLPTATSRAAGARAQTRARPLSRKMVVSFASSEQAATFGPNPRRRATNSEWPETGRETRPETGRETSACVTRSRRRGCRACWVTQALSGLGVQPERCRQLEPLHSGPRCRTACDEGLRGEKGRYGSPRPSRQAVTAETPGAASVSSIAQSTASSVVIRRPSSRSFSNASSPSALRTASTVSS
jgi:hypothetical protein